MQAYPQRFAILGYPPVDRPESPSLIATWKQRPGMLACGCTSTGRTTDPGRLTARSIGSGRRQRRRSWPLALLAGDWLPYLAQIAGSHPGLKLAVDHMGALRGAKGDAAFPNMKELTALAKYPNVSVKLTGGPFYADDAYPFRSLHKHYRTLYDAFGPRRLFRGTDITKMPCSWRQCVTRFQEIVWIPEADKQLIMGRSICDWLGWKP